MTSPHRCSAGECPSCAGQPGPRAERQRAQEQGVCRAVQGSFLVATRGCRCGSPLRDRVRCIVTRGDGACGPGALGSGLPGDDLVPVTTAHCSDPMVSTCQKVAVPQKAIVATTRISSACALPVISPITPALSAIVPITVTTLLKTSPQRG